MTEPLVCGHPTPNGPCTRKVLPGAGGCGFHPAPPDSPEQRHPEPMASSQCPRPLVLARAEADTPPRCFLCTKPVAALLQAEGGPGKVHRCPAIRQKITTSSSSTCSKTTAQEAVSTSGQ